MTDLDERVGEAGHAPMRHKSRKADHYARSSISLVWVLIVALPWFAGLTWRGTRDGGKWLLRKTVSGMYLLAGILEVLVCGGFFILLGVVTSVRDWVTRLSSQKS